MEIAKELDLSLTEQHFAILEWLRKEMGDCLMATIRTMTPIPVPVESFEARRNQYYSTRILKEMLGDVPQDALKLLGVTDEDYPLKTLRILEAAGYIRTMGKYPQDRAFMVPNGCSTVWRRRRMASGFPSSRCCTASSSASSTPFLTAGMNSFGTEPPTIRSEPSTSRTPRWRQAFW